MRCQDSFMLYMGTATRECPTKPMLRQAWATGDLIDKLVATRQAFGYTGPAGSTPPQATGMQPTASTSQQPDDLLPRQRGTEDCTVPASIF